MKPAQHDSVASRQIAVAAFLVLVVFGIAGRLLPHPPNVTPLVAVTLFAGFLFRPRAVAIAVPLLVMLISDSFMGFYDWRIMASVYAAFILPVLLTPILRTRPTVLRVVGCSVLSSVVFFAASNFAVWAFSGMYERSSTGLAACYIAAIPFFRNTFLGDLAWSSLLFGLYSAVVRIVPAPSLRSLLRPRQVIPAPIA
jgi:hypothetical protein